MREIVQLIWFCSILFLLLPSLWGLEGEWVRQGAVSTRLILPADGIESESSFWLGWQIKRDSGWHTYWEHPGDVGVAPSLSWDLPDGFQCDPPLFSPPLRVYMFDIGAYGHKNETLFLLRIHAPQLSPGNLLTLRARANWLACSDTCLPGQTDLKLEVPVRENPVPDINWKKRMDHFLRSSPKGLPSQWRGRVTKAGKFYKLEFSTPGIPPGGDVDFFIQNRMARSQSLPLVKRKKDGLDILLEQSPWAMKDARRLKGLLQFNQTTGIPVYYRVDLPL